MTPSPDRKAEATDLELIDRWKGGDSRAATMLVGRHSAALARFAVSGGEREGVDELGTGQRGKLVTPCAR